MGEIIEFPANTQTQTDSAAMPSGKDPYYHFIHTVVVTAKACGFAGESAVDEIYRKTRETSAVARLLRNTP
jgi:hypothetical protein